MKKQLAKSWQQIPLVEVVWLDAAINTEHEGQLDDKDGTKKFGGLTLCSDIGYLIAKTRTEVKLAVGLCREDNSYRHSNTIPRGWVKAIHYLHRPDDQPSDPPTPNGPAGPGDRPS